MPGETAGYGLENRKSEGNLFSDGIDDNDAKTRALSSIHPVAKVTPNAIMSEKSGSLTMELQNRALHRQLFEKKYYFIRLLQSYGR